MAFEPDDLFREVGWQMLFHDAMAEAEPGVAAANIDVSRGAAVTEPMPVRDGERRGRDRHGE
jgi:hypothetical protein